MRLSHIFALTAITISAGVCQDLTCDLSGYKPQEGLTAQNRSGALEVVWQGERREQLRARFAIRAGQPLVRELAARKSGGTWIVLGQNLTPEFEITSGVRRLSQQQMAPLKDLKVELTPEVVEREKWNAFWDSPLMVPGRPGTNMDLPRKPEEIRKAWAKYHASRLPGEDRRARGWK